MTENPTNENPTSEIPVTEPGFTTPHADRPPTADEERVADEAAEDVDLERVAEHAEAAMQTGADVRGEGQIEPDPA